MIFDLNKEFDKLVEELYNNIRTKQISGEFSRAEADDLTDRFRDVLRVGEDAYNGTHSSWDNSGCAWQSSVC